MMEVVSTCGESVSFCEAAGRNVLKDVRCHSVVDICAQTCSGTVCSSKPQLNETRPQPDFVYLRCLNMALLWWLNNLLSPSS
jgi:hypothetical protein